MLAIIANPGFYRSDELNITSHIQRNGIQDYLSSYLTLEPHQEFAFNVRPVAYLVEGLVSLLLPDYPFLVHLADVLMHWLVAVLLFLAIVQFCGRRQLAWLSSILFIISPLAVFSVGWTGALMDRLYLLFGLLAFLAAHAYITGRRGYAALAVVIFSSVLAMLSKETALVLSAALAVYWFFPIQNMNRRRLWAAFLAWSLPVLLLVLYRLPYLIEGFKGNINSAYAPSFLNAPIALFGYFLFPFLPFVEEASFSLFQPMFYTALAVACNLILLYLIVRAFSVRTLLAYLIGYSLFLIPVLTLPITHMFAHYLYGSGVAFSIALAALLLAAQDRLHLLLPALLIAIASLHTLVIQRYFYRHGLCMHTMLTSLNVAYVDDNMPKHMSILAMPGSQVQSLSYYTEGRKYPTEFTILDWDKRQEWTDYVFNCDCILHKRPGILLEVKEWGPVSTIVNNVANRQSDGNGAFWIKVEKLDELGRLEVLLDGQPALQTKVRPGLITAKFPPEQYAQEGKYQLEIRQLESGKTLRVGTFVVEPLSAIDKN